MRTYPGTLEQYFRMCREENEIARREAALRERALTDPELQCEHHMSLYRGCKECE